MNAIWLFLCFLGVPFTHLDEPHPMNLVYWIYLACLVALYQIPKCKWDAWKTNGYEALTACMKAPFIAVDVNEINNRVTTRLLEMQIKLAAIEARLAQERAVNVSIPTHADVHDRFIEMKKEIDKASHVRSMMRGDLDNLKATLNKFISSYESTDKMVLVNNENE